MKHKTGPVEGQVSPVLTNHRTALHLSMKQHKGVVSGIQHF